MPKKKTIPTDDIVVDGNIIRYYGESTPPTIKQRTEKGGWKSAGYRGTKKEIDQAWAELYAERDTDSQINNTGHSLEVVSGKSEPGSLLDPIAAQINEEYAVFEDLEKQATMSMLKIGLLMEHVKEQLPHGQFKKWAEKNLSISYRHAHSFRKLAQVFIAAQQIDQNDMLALVDPENSQAALGEKLRQMAFDFIGGKTQGELLEAHGIRCRENAAQKELPKPKPKPLKPGETQAHRDATDLVFPVMTQVVEYFTGDHRVVQHLTLAELKTIQGDLIDAKRTVDELIKAG